MSVFTPRDKTVKIDAGLPLDNALHVLGMFIRDHQTTHTRRQDFVHYTMDSGLEMSVYQTKTMYVIRRDGGLLPLDDEAAVHPV